jgi:hypothetical protein
MPTKQELMEQNDQLSGELMTLKYEVMAAIKYKDSCIAELESLALHYEQTINVLSGRLMALNSVAAVEETPARNA